MADEKMFTQDEVNQIVSKRLNAEQAKLQAQYETANRRLRVREELMRRGFDGNLADVLDISDDQTAQNNIDTMVNIMLRGKPPMAGVSRPSTGGMFSASGIYEAEGQRQSAKDIRSAMGLEKR